MKVLIASSNQQWIQKYQVLLYSWGFDTVICTDGISALQQLQIHTENIFITLLDEDLQGMSVENILFRIRSKIVTTYQYCIIMTENQNVEKQLILLNSGADRVLSQVDPLEILRMELFVAQRIMEYQIRQKTVQEDLWTQANHDVLTNIANRRSILRALEKQASSCMGKDKSLGLLMIDLDYFKKINDSFGHDIGDQVLTEVAQRMRKSLRSIDMIGRFGGEEFLAIIPDCKGEELVRLAERIRLVVNKAIQTSSAIIPISCSIGISVFQGTHGTETDVNWSLQQADKALYVAKEM
jgi:diguanylate cyclase (GGDEF)-like protein